MSIVIVGTLDTKGEEIEFVRAVVESQGEDVHAVDTGVMGDPAFDPDTSASRVAERADTTLDALREDADRGEAITAMGRGAAAVARDLREAGTLDAIIGLGGSGNTSVATEAMRALPYGVPKVMVSTMASGDVRPYVGATDVMMLYSVADIEGLNQLSRRILSNAALAVVGMVQGDPDVDVTDRPTVGLTMFGVTTPCAHRAREILEERGYEVIVFHATGTGGRAMEALVEQGVIDGVLDLTTTELADELVGGVLSAGPHRLEAAAKAGVPQVVSTGALDMVNFGPKDDVPERFRERNLHVHNPQVTLMRTTPEENAELGWTLAEKVNRSSGPVTAVLPLGGVSMLDAPGEDFHDPDADEALFDAIRERLDERVDLDEVDANVNDERFAGRLADLMDESMRAAGYSP